MEIIKTGNNKIDICQVDFLSKMQKEFFEFFPQQGIDAAAQILYD